MFELRIRSAVYWCIHKADILQEIQDFLKDWPYVSFQDEVKRCLMGNTNQLTFCVLSKVLRCVIHHWLVHRSTEGKRRLQFTRFVPSIPDIDLVKRIEVLEMVGEVTKCLFYWAEGVELKDTEPSF